MAWSGSTYRKGNYATNGWTGDAANNIGIEAGRHDVQDDDFAQGITDCINKNGLNTPSTNLPMGGNKHTGVGNAVNASDYMAYGQIRNGTPLYMDTINNRLGIGTASPGTRLDLGTNANGSAFFTSTNGTDANLQFSFGTQLATITNGGGSGSLAFQTGGNFERMRIDSSGRVGIGVSNPTYTLDVQTSSNSIQAFRFINSNAGSAAMAQMILGNDQSVSAAAIILNSNAATGAYNGASGLNVYQGLNAPLSFWTAATERIRINSVGQVGIGTTTPAYQLVIQNNQNASTATQLYNPNAGSSANVQILFGNDGSSTAAAIALNSSTNTSNGGANSLNIINGLSAPIVMYTAGVERYRASGTGDTILRNGRLFFDTILSSGAGTHFVKWNSTNGLVTYDSSSALIKEDIVDCPYGIDAVQTLQPRKYFRKDDQREEIGFIADEVINVIPELVSSGKKSIITNNPNDEEIVPVSLSYEKLTAVLCKAIQELNYKIETLEAKIENLESVTAGL